MATARSRGILLVGVGFVLTALVGLWLASQDVEVGTIILAGGVAFVFIFPIYLYGIYLYSREEDDDTDEVSSMALQLALIDMLKQHGQMTFDELAEQMNVSRAEVTDLLRQLIELDVFMGRVDWDTGMVYAA